MSLSGQQRKKLQEALIDAFPTKSSLEQMLSFELDKNLDANTGEGSLQDIVFRLIQAANSQGWVEDLVRGACNENPGNPALKAIAKELFDDLSSARNVDYTQLRDFLKAGQWKEADKETLAVMLKAFGRETQGWLDDESIENFPCTDLRTIDQLWIKYSDGRFGFSVQKRIWESVGKDYGKFGDAIGSRSEIEEEIEKGWWMNKKKERVKVKKWIGYDKVKYETKAPPGHLPAYLIFYLDYAAWNRWFLESEYDKKCSRFSERQSRTFLLFFSRIQTCEL